MQNPPVRPVSPMALAIRPYNPICAGAVPRVRPSLPALAGVCLVCTGLTVNSHADENALQVQAEFDNQGAVVIEVASTLPPDTCVSLSVNFEGDLVDAGLAAVRLDKLGRARRRIGPFVGRRVLYGLYSVEARVTPTNQDARLSFFQGKTTPIVAAVNFAAGLPQEIAQNRKEEATYLARLVSDCGARRDEVRRGYEALVAGTRFTKGPIGQATFDQVAWDAHLEHLLDWQQRATARHRQCLNEILGPCFPSVSRTAAFNLLGGMGRIVRDYGVLGYEHYHVEPPADLPLKSVLKPDLAVLEHMFEREARTILQAVGELPPRRLVEVIVQVEKLPPGMAATTAPQWLRPVTSANPATLTGGELAKLAEASDLSPALDFVGAREAYWLGAETVAESEMETKWSAAVWIVAYDGAERRAAAVGKLQATLGNSPVDHAFGGEQFLCWLHAEGPLSQEGFTRLCEVFHQSLGW